MNFNNYKFRCSAVGNLFVEPQSKAAKDAGELSETTKTWLNEIFIEQYYGRRKEITSKYMTKGNICEEQSISIVQEALDETYIEKNEQRLDNDYIVGTPDIILDEMVIDCKTTWDLWTFFKKDATNKLYYYQLQSYMLLTGRTKSALFYTLVNTPEHLLEADIRKATYQYEAEELTEAIDNIKINSTFDDIPVNQRYKAFYFDADTDFADKLKSKVEKAREYLNDLLTKTEQSNVPLNS